MKIECSKCKLLKDIKEFYYRSDRKSGHTSHCKICTNKRIKIYQTTNKNYLDYDKNRHQTKQYKEYHKIYIKKWYQDNKETIDVYIKEYNIKNKNKIRDYYKIYNKFKLKNDIQFKINKSLRDRFRHAIINKQKVGSAVRDLGCTIDELKLHIEKQFKPGMAWDNWGHQTWHIDHIKAFANFDLTDRNQLLQACHYTNLQPMWAKDNFSKGKRY